MRSHTLFCSIIIAVLALSPIGKVLAAAADDAHPTATAVNVDLGRNVCRSATAMASPSVAKGNLRARRTFAFDLLTAVAGEGKGNIAVSPFGVTEVLTALDLGADPKMKAAITRVLRLGAPDAGATMEALRKDARLLSASGSRAGSPFGSANGLFVDHAVELSPGIEDLIQAESGIKLEKLDFGSPAAIEQVNHWAAERTGGRIASILEPGSSPSLVAVNAFAFKDCWRFKFDPAATAQQPFHQLAGTTVARASMVLDEQELGYAAKGRFAALDLPYADSGFVMTLVTTLDGPAPLAAFGAAGDLLVGAGQKPTQVRLTLPKFSGTGELDLFGVLSKLGLSAGLASKTQFSGFARGLTLSSMRQKAFVAVDETGTEAAAVTAATMSRDVQPGPMPVRVKFDRPFVYVLRHRATGTILMTGYVADPES